MAVLDAVREPAFLERATTLGHTIRPRLDALAARRPEIGEVRGLGPMLAFELTEHDAGPRVRRSSSAAFERGLLLLACGMYGNVIRLLAPLTISDDELDEGMTLLEESIAAA